MIRTSIEYTGELHCVATHGPSKSRISTDAPVDNHGKGETFSPTDLLGAALGTCIATVMAIYAERKGIDLKGMRVEVTKEMSATPPRRIARLATEVWLPVLETVDPAKHLEKIALSCPVHHSLHPEIEKPVVFHYAQ
jgi:uncharacterized OsmC-like protein